MVNFPNDIYVICAFIGINCLLYQVSKVPCPNRASLSAAGVIQWLRPHSGADIQFYSQDIIRVKVRITKPNFVSIENR